MAEHTPTPYKVGGKMSVTSALGNHIETVQVVTDNCVVALAVNEFEYMREGEAQTNAEFIVRACNSHEELLGACRCALADLEGIMPEFEPSGDRTYPAWQTIKELTGAIREAEER